MNRLVLREIIKENERNLFINEVQEAFQLAYIKEFGDFD